MNPPPFHPAALLLPLVAVCCVSLASAADLEKSNASLEIRSINPASPAKLKAGERLNVTIDYRNPEARSVRIWARPFTKGNRTGGYAAHPSASYQGVSGTAEGWFYFDRPTEVDEVRVEMVDGGNEVIARASLPIKAEWTGERIAAKGSASGAGTATAASAPKASVAVGDLIEIKFTAVDGREVDLVKLRGKVVLIDFWATWCGPCIAELPHVLEAYQKFHDKGFEIVGISFDQDKGALERMTKEKGMAWPQYFDGKGWKNDFGVKYGIRGIPTMWLIDPQGRIATTTARNDLAGQVETLLAGKTVASVPAAPFDSRRRIRVIDKTAPLPPAAPSPAPPAPAASATAVALKIPEPVLRKDGVFGFSQEKATVFCDSADLRLSVWNNSDYLYAQAILWKDDDSALGKTGDGRVIGDSSTLVLDVDADGEVTKDVDRDYMLNPWPTMGGLFYQIRLRKGAWTTIKSDTKGRGAIRYVQLPDGRKVRVDSYVIPLAEISRKVPDKIQLSYRGNSTVPRLSVHSTSDTPSGRSSAQEYVLASGAELALESVPDGRKDPSLIAPRHRESMPKVGALAPEIAAKDWLNTSGAPTLAALRGQVVLVEFWATWCGPCVKSIPHLNELQKKFAGRGFKLVSFTEQDRNGIEAFIKRTPMDYIIGTESEATFDRYGVTGIPAAFVVDKAGKIAWAGNSGDPALEGAIQAALGSR